MVEKAGVFEVALPGALAAAVSASSSSTTTNAGTAGKNKNDELAGVGLAFYSQIYVLKVPIAGSACAHATAL